MEIYRQLIPDLQGIVDEFRFKKEKPLSKRQFKACIVLNKALMQRQLLKYFVDSNGISNWQYGSFQYDWTRTRWIKIGNKDYQEPMFEIWVTNDENKAWFRLGEKLRLKIAGTELTESKMRDYFAKCQFNNNYIPRQVYTAIEQAYYYYLTMLA